jgi:hypothetical protein
MARAMVTLSRLRNTGAPHAFGRFLQPGIEPVHARFTRTCL